jgi:hypothetical protein
MGNKILNWIIEIDGNADRYIEKYEYCQDNYLPCITVIPFDEEFDKIEVDVSTINNGVQQLSSYYIDHIRPLYELYAKNNYLPQEHNLFEVDEDSIILMVREQDSSKLADMCLDLIVLLIEERTVNAC